MVSIIGHGFIANGLTCAFCNYPAEFPAHWTGTYTGPWPLPDVTECVDCDAIGPHDCPSPGEARAAQNAPSSSLENDE